MDNSISLHKISYENPALENLMQENTALKAENAKLTSAIAELTEKINWFMVQFKLNRQRQFGASSEKSQYDFTQLSIFNEAEYFAKPNAPEPEITVIKEYRRKTRLTTDKLPPNMPVEVVEHILSEKEQVCPECNNQMRSIGKETVREELKLIPAHAVITQHVRYAYGCPVCEKEAETPTIIKAPVPEPVIKGSFASPEAVAHIMVQKFTMGVPLYRQEKEYERHGINLSRQTMSNWLLVSAALWLTPIYDRLHQLYLTRDVAFSDETEFQVLHEPGRRAQQKSYLWVYRTGSDGKPPIVLCEYQPGRGSEHPKAFLSGYKGYLHADAWEAYHKLPPDIIIVSCWAHARRMYDEALKTLPDKAREDSDAMKGKRYCNLLFDIERKLVDCSAEERYSRRLEMAKPILDQYYNWLISFGELGKSLFGKAVRYSLNQWKYLVNYLLDGRLEISNNRTERTVKNFVIDRKNFLFANTPRGATASAIIFSLVETAKENRLNPYDYLVFVLRNAPNLNIQKNPEVIEKLLPHVVYSSIKSGSP